MASCVFCQIVAGSVTSQRIYEDAQAMAFMDIRPQAPTHVILIPKQHIPTVLDLSQPQQLLIGHLVLVANELARSQGVAEQGFRVVINCGPAGGQTVDHLHLHLLGGRTMHWPPG